MTDRHLNLFYSYNHDRELIEDNLTRAFIVSLRMLLPETRHHLLRSLLQHPSKCESTSGPFVASSFHDAQFALQDHIEDQINYHVKRNRPLKFAQKWVVAISTATPEDITATHEGDGKGRPDGWLYDMDQDYCYLIESKVGANPVNNRQLRRHAKWWFGLEGRDFEEHLICCTWHDVLRAIDTVCELGKSHELQLGIQDTAILESLAQFLGYFGYRRFRGFHFDALQPPPSFLLFRPQILPAQLEMPPGFRLGQVLT